MADERADRWRRASDIFAAALELPEPERGSFLADSCGDDHELLAEVRSLMVASDSADGFFEGLAERIADAAAVSSEPGALEGTTIGHFVVGDLIGRGGMGEVYRAVDQRLNRRVALKFLSAALTALPDRVQRFRREARIVASLRHPKIAAIYGIEEVDGRIFLVLELVEGPTLKDRLAAGPLPVPEALDVARQIAEGFEAAHETGIVHRDLKPANVKIDLDGEVRVLDFGIASPPERRSAPRRFLSETPSGSDDSTLEGLVIGTVAYMSPEQARGKPMDRRSDVWAFGALVYELLCGRKAFPGEDHQEMIARILETEPDWDALPPGTPPAVTAMLRRCLDRDVHRRLQAIGEARIVLEDALADPTGAHAADATRPRARSGVAVAVTALALVLVAWGLWGPGRAAEPVPRTFRLAVAEDATAPVISPPGDRVTFVDDDVGWVVSFDGAAPRRLDGTAGGYGFFWSPDGRDLGFLRDGSLWRIPADGGRPAVVGAAAGGAVSEAAWLEDGTIVAAIGPDLFSYPETGGEPRLVWTRPEGEEVGPRGLYPGPSGSLYMILGDRRIVLLDDGRLVDVFATERGEIVDVAYAPPGHVVFRRDLVDEGIWALPVDRSGRRRGDPFLLNTIRERPTTSRAGDLVYLDRRTSRQQRNLMWVDRRGGIIGVIGTPQARLEQFDLSPSGRRVVAVAEEEGRRRIWVHDLDSGDRFALSPMPDPGQRWPAWAPDEDRVAFRFDRDGQQWIGIKGLEPGTPAVHLGPGIYPSFAGDGAVVYNYRGDILRLDPDANEAPAVLVGTDRSESQVRISSNGLMAFLGETPTGAEVFVARYDDPGRRWQVSENGGRRPRWRGDGGELYYLDGETVMAVTVDADGAELAIGRPAPLFELSVTGAWGEEFDPDPSGQRFLMVRALPRMGIDDVDGITLIQNWAAAFEGR